MPAIVDPDCTSLKGARHGVSQVQVIGEDSSSKTILGRVGTRYHLSERSKQSFDTLFLLLCFNVLGTTMGPTRGQHTEYST